MLRQKQINFIEDIPTNIIIETDPDKLNLIFRNLIANSIKYTPTNGTIEVSLATTGDDIVISVSDTGVGMDAGTQASLFGEPMSREGTNAEKGTGIGLNLCKQMIEDLGGKIWVESTLHQGSTFSFSLPTIGTTTH